MMIFKNNAFVNVNTEDVAFEMLNDDPTVGFDNVAVAMIATEKAIEELNELSMNIATESTILFANALEGQKVSETEGISTEAVEGFGIEEDDDAATQAGKAQGKKMGDYVKKAGDGVMTILKKIAEFFKTLWKALTNVFNSEEKQWANIIEKSKDKSEKVGKVTINRTVNPEYWQLLKDAYNLTFEMYNNYNPNNVSTVKQVATGNVIGVDITVSMTKKLDEEDRIHPLVSKQESDVETELRKMNSIKFPTVSISKAPSIFNKFGAKIKKNPTSEATTMILKGRSISFLYGTKIQSLINVSKVCRAAVSKEVDSGKDCTELAKLGRATYAHLKKAL